MKTRITELLGIKYPIIQSAMAYVAYPSLVAAVSEAGGLGILGASPMTPEEVRKSIHQIRERTDKPFGVNFLPYHPQADEVLQVMIEEKVAVASYGRGDPKKIVERTKSHGIINMPTIGAVRHAVRTEGYGADALVVQGMEGGGHTSYVATTVLLPLVMDVVEVPVVAAGGFADARGLVAALAMGAEGIAMGTRFALTKESPIPDSVKQFYLESSENDTIITARVTGTRCRGLRNQLTDMLEAEKRGFPLLRTISGLLQMRRAFNVPWWRLLSSALRMKQAYEVPISGLGELAYASFGGERMHLSLVQGDRGLGFMPCGQVCGRIDDIPTCKELIERIVHGAEEILDSIGAKIRS
ncbi:MAG: nitronate monooxygenase [Chloroflexi bacterium]|nr:nitronate monooxygenase [Chloroflexota bacterium]